MIDAPGPDRARTGLSPAGAARRDAMLAGLLDEVRTARRRRRRARAARAGGVLALVVIALGVAASALRAPDAGRPPAGAEAVAGRGDAVPAPARDSGADPPPGTTGVVLVRTDPAVLDRYGIVPGTAGVAILEDDRALLAELAAIRRPTGLVRTAGRVWLTGDVVDEL